jgi:hypothetical protein
LSQSSRAGTTSLVSRPPPPHTSVLSKARSPQEPELPRGCALGRRVSESNRTMWIWSFFKRVALLSACAGICAAADLTVDASKPLPYRIPRAIFGTFLEPIGKSIYGGLWAQILENPSFEENLWSAANLKAKLDADPSLYRSSGIGLPIPWKPLDWAGWRYEPRWGDAANSARSLFIMGLAGRQIGVRQSIYLSAEVHGQHLC